MSAVSNKIFAAYLKEDTSVSHTFIIVKVKVKQSHYRPGQTLRVPGG
jgi:hypothetical protein